MVAARKPDRRTEATDLRMELNAMHARHVAEAARLRGEIARLRDALTYAFAIDSWDIALTVRDRLTGIASRLDAGAA